MTHYLTKSARRSLTDGYNEKVVADIARKTPVMQGYPNVHHSRLCLNELLGEAVETRLVPQVGGGIPVRSGDTVSIHFKSSPEAEAFARWNSGQFHEVERLFAKEWREQMQNFDLAQVGRLVKETVAQHSTPKTLEDIYAIAAHAVSGGQSDYAALKLSIALLGIPADMRQPIMKRWHGLGRLPLAQYAPYTAYCLLVDLFFYLAVYKRLI